SLPAAIEEDDNQLFERIQTTFAAVVSGLDRLLAKLLAGCRKRGFGKHALIAVTSDLGFPLGESGHVGQSAGKIEESLLHLPLIVRKPDLADAGERINRFSVPADVSTMIAQHFGIDVHLAVPREHLLLHGNDEIAVRTVDYLLVHSDSTNKLFL